jgi:sec-independent protein translocase protein TatB
MIVVFVVVLVIFGPQKLPELARGLGKLMAEFRKASGDFKSAFEEEMREIERQTALNERRKAAEVAAATAMAEPSAPHSTVFATQAGAAEPSEAPSCEHPSSAISPDGVPSTEAEANSIAPPGTRLTEGDLPVITPVAESVPRAERPTEVFDAAQTSKSAPSDHPHDRQPA